MNNAGNFHEAFQKNRDLCWGGFALWLVFEERTKKERRKEGKEKKSKIRGKEIIIEKLGQILLSGSSWEGPRFRGKWCVFVFNCHWNELQ